MIFRCSGKRQGEIDFRYPRPSQTVWRWRSTGLFRPESDGWVRTLLRQPDTNEGQDDDSHREEPSA